MLNLKLIDILYIDLLLHIDLFINIQQFISIMQINATIDTFQINRYIYR